jgi:hypothetical protein
LTNNASAKKREDAAEGYESLKWIGAINEECSGRQRREKRIASWKMNCEAARCNDGGGEKRATRRG